MADEVDPFSKVFIRLWEMARDTPRFTSLVRLRNSILLANQGYVQEKDEVSQADLPEVALYMAGLSSGLRATSSGTSATLQFQWFISTGDDRVDQFIGPALFAIACAMVNWPEEAYKLTWKDQTFIKDLNLTEGSIGLTDPTKNRGVAGWSAIWNCEVKMWFETQSIIEAGLESAIVQ